MVINNCAEISEIMFFTLHPEEQEVMKIPREANKMYAIGDWIRVAHWNYSGFVGYILERNDITRKYKIRLVKNKDGQRIDATLILDEDAIYSVDLEGGFDTSFLLDLAIDWSLVQKNEKLFNQLIEEKGGNENVIEG